MTTTVSKNAKTGTIDFASCTYKWVISDYTSYDNLSNKSFLESPVFNVANAEWYLRLYPSGDRKDSKDYVSIFLFCQNDTDFRARLLFTILDDDEQFYKIYDSKKSHIFKKSVGWGTMKFVEKSKIKELDTVLEDKELIILCEIRVDNESIHQTLTSNNLSRLTHFHKFETLVDEKKFSDVKFIIDGQEILAHKNIITANSEVFAAMFEHDMKENQENTVKIEDVKYPVMYELLRFMYSGKIEGIDDIASELFVAADKYKLLELKDICERQLCDDLSVHNVIDCINLADLHNAEMLKTKARDFLVANGKDMIDLAGFSTIAKMSESSLVDIFRSIFLKEKNKTDGESENK